MRIDVRTTNDVLAAKRAMTIDENHNPVVIWETKNRDMYGTPIAVFESLAEAKADPDFSSCEWGVTPLCAY